MLDSESVKVKEDTSQDKMKKRFEKRSNQYRIERNQKQRERGRERERERQRERIKIIRESRERNDRD